MCFHLQIFTISMKRPFSYTRAVSNMYTSTLAEHLKSHIIPNEAVILLHLCYGKISFAVLDLGHGPTLNIFTWLLI